MGAYRFGQTARTVVDYVTGSRRKAQIERLQQEVRARNVEIATLESFLSETGIQNASLAGEVAMFSHQAYRLREDLERREDDLVSQQGRYENRLARTQKMVSDRGHLVRRLRSSLWNMRRGYGKLFAKDYMETHPKEFAFFADSNDQVIAITKRARRALGYDLNGGTPGRDIYELIEPLVENVLQLRTKLKLEIGDKHEAIPLTLDLTRPGAKRSNKMHVWVLPKWDKVPLRQGATSSIFIGALVREYTSAELRVKKREDREERAREKQAERGHNADAEAILTRIRGEMAGAQRDIDRRLSR